MAGCIPWPRIALDRRARYQKPNSQSAVGWVGVGLDTPDL
jgi:hypothetical protein